MLHGGPAGNYGYYVKIIELKVARIGNSRGVRLPAATLERYGIGTSVMMEERSDGILLRPHGAANPKLSWEDTAREMAASAEDWAAWDATSADGLDDTPWGPVRSQRVAEREPQYARRRERSTKRSGKRSAKRSAKR
jgi:antitoxin component of MazEF toxin-antitoxin module